MYGIQTQQNSVANSSEARLMINAAVENSQKKNVSERFFWEYTASSLKNLSIKDAADSIQTMIKGFRNRYIIQTIDGHSEGPYSIPAVSDPYHARKQPMVPIVETDDDNVSSSNYKSQDTSDKPPVSLHNTDCFSVITSIDLSNQNISYIPPFFYRNLTQVQHLFLSQNRIKVIPDDMPEHMRELTVLKLDGNCIEHLPDSMSHWTKLNEIWLGSEFGEGNSISHLPESTSALVSLLELNISHNILNSLSSIAFHQLVNIRHIDLSYNRLKRLPERLSLSSCYQLSSMDLSHNQLEKLPSTFVFDLVRLIQHHTFQYLDLSNNHINVLPKELLCQPQAQIVIKGNPMTTSSSSYSRQGDYPTVGTVLESSGVNDAANHSIHTDENGVRNEEAVDNDNIDNMENAFEINIMASAARLTTVVDSFEGFDINDNYGEDYNETEHATLEPSEQVNNCLSVLSLKEISLRLFLSRSSKLAAASNLLPEYIRFDIEKTAQLCPHCLRPFIYEWKSGIQFKTIHGYPSVPHQVRFCNTKCMKDYGAQLEQKYLAAQSNVRIPSIHETHMMPEPDSFEWVMMATIAASVQEEEADLLANISMTMI